MDFNKLQHLLDGIASIDRAEDAETVVSIFSNIASSYGFSSYCILRMDNPARVPPERALRVANWPADYLDHRIKEPSYRLHDPVLSMAMRCRRPFFWHEAQETADKIGLKVMNESREFGLEKGLAYPIHDTSGIPGIVSLSYSDAE
ncbi:MAG: autoinducer binding domain-containing protein, partial [Pseudomonadota bacterium]